MPHLFLLNHVDESYFQQDTGLALKSQAFDGQLNALKRQLDKSNTKQILPQHKQAPDISGKKHDITGT